MSTALGVGYSHNIPGKECRPRYARKGLACELRRGGARLCALTSTSWQGCRPPAACAQVLLISHEGWFRMQRCKDRFEACLGLSALRAASPAGVLPPSKAPAQPWVARVWLSASQVHRPTWMLGARREAFVSCRRQRAILCAAC